MQKHRQLTADPAEVPFGFAGCLYDQDTKLCHFGAREYDPSTGRWLSKDPLSFGGGDTNLCGYTMNDPINLIDPTGKAPVGPIIGIITVVVIIYIIYDINHQPVIVKDPYLNQMPKPKRPDPALPPGTDPGSNNCYNTCC